MRILAALFTLMSALPVAAHEFWIEPEAYKIPADGMLQGALVNGEDFEGTELAFLPQRFRFFVAQFGDQRGNVDNRIGARPALDITPPNEGLFQIAYVSTLSTLSYSEWEKFLKFADHKDFQNIEARHDARGLPRTGFSEGYWRFAKTLMGVGHSDGDDSRMGMEIEFVALDNPYTVDLSDGLRVQLHYQDTLLADAQVEVFEKSPDDAVTITLYRTNAEGIAVLPVKPGHSYLVDHVVLREPSADMTEQTGAVWETLWAALTFAIPQ